VTATSSRDPAQDRGVVNRQVRRGPIWRTWTSAPGATTGQAVTLTFPVPVRVRSVVLHDVRPGDEAGSTLHVTAATVTLFADGAATQSAGSSSTGPLSVDGTAVPFADVLARVVRVSIDGSTGTFYGISLVGLSELEVVARGE
jgi:hypothetical protein